MKDYKPEQRDRYELGFLLCPIRWPILWLPWQHCSFTGPTSIPSPLYALVFFLRLCLVGVKIERMENIERKIRWKTLNSVFHRLANERKWGGRKPGRKFSLRGPQFSSSQIMRKIWRGKYCENTFTQIPSPNVYNNPTRQNKKEAENNYQTQHHHQTPELSTEN